MRVESLPAMADGGATVARLPQDSDWESFASSSVGLSPRDGDLRFAFADLGTQKGKVSPFERELRAGLEALNQGKMPAAVSHFETAQKADPRDFRPFFFEAVARLQLEEVARAAAALDIAISLAPSETELYLHRGNLHSRQRDYGLAVDDFSRVVAVQPDHLAALLNRAVANFHRRRPKDIVEDSSAALKVKAGIPDAHLLRALGYLMQGETVRARRDFDAAVASGLNKSAIDSWSPLFRSRT
ncbi:MAG: tetratricopeptide repeat protein [Planctomycetia bacterium]|nr:tetratricopeptide repeat protein [Planctomycetia bacterium]